MSKEIQVKIKNEKAMLFTPYNMDFVKRIKQFSDARWDTLDILPRLKPWDSLNFLTGSPLSKGSDIAVVFRIQTYRRSHVVWYLAGLWSDAGPHIILMLKTETLFH